MRRQRTDPRPVKGMFGFLTATERKSRRKGS